MAPARKPLVTLPRGVDEEQAQVKIFIEVSRAPAGCFVCDRPIPKGVSRFSLVVRLPQPIVNRSGQTRIFERYNAHSGCLAQSIKGSEVLRTRDSCYDCGFQKTPEPEVDDENGAAVFTQGYRMWSAWCFTTSKFAPAPLCDQCLTKTRKWAQCPVCTIYYPPWMIHRVADVEPDDDPVPINVDPFGASRRRPDIEAGAQACFPCCSRWGWVTIDEAETAKTDWEQRRADILEHGLFDAGDDDA